MNCPDGQERACHRGRLADIRAAMLPRQIIKYVIDSLLVIVPLAAILYFLFDPDAFNAFLDWLMRAL
jgi:hypothetical protein